ncbi:MAG: diaminopimelate epimerase [Endomicrobium sp.]|jgi:diaminopimelate epimerase|nr:diaminopimelate epimerase [Endomicrobium sp.]
MKINFSKLTAAGNDFILIDNREEIIKCLDYQALAKKICDRKYSIGADGLILLEKSNMFVDFKMKYINSDGSFASMCGNGSRSIAKFAYEIGLVNLKMSFETDAGTVNAEILETDKNNVRVYLYNPKDLVKDIKVLIDEKEFNIDFINTGVPHAIIFVDCNIIDINVVKYGRSVRYHEKFTPNGVNVNFVKIIDNKTISVRTYERGVEDETLACGTGVTASAIVSVIRNFVKSPVCVITKGGDKLFVSLRKKNNDKVDNVTLEGPAYISFRGTIEI